MTIWQYFSRQFQRDWLISCRSSRLLVNNALFFLMVLVFFPLTLPARTALIQQTAPGLIWISVLLGQLLSAERLFKQDYEEGVIEQWLLSPAPLPLLISAKITVHWLLTLIPLLIYCPILSFLFGFSYYQTGILALSFCCGSPAILCISALVAATTTNLQQQSVYMALLLLPLTIPILIFGSGCLMLSMQHLSAWGNLALLLAFSIAAYSFLPLAIAAIIRISLAD